MALTPSFSITPTSNPGIYTITDTSTGTDGTITGRKILLYDVNNTLLQTVDFPIAQSSITITLSEDIGLNVVVNWLNISGIIVYTYDLIYAFVGFGMSFLFQLTQFQISNPQIVNDLNWYGNKTELFILIQSALNAIDIGQSLAAAQSQILLYQVLLNNSNFYF